MGKIAALAVTAELGNCEFVAALSAGRTTEFRRRRVSTIDAFSDNIKATAIAAALLCRKMCQNELLSPPESEAVNFKTHFSNNKTKSISLFEK